MPTLVEREMQVRGTMRNTYKTFAAATLLTAILLAGVTPPAAATSQSDGKLPEGDQPVRVILPLAHSTDLPSAVRYGTGLDAVAYAFDNGAIVGEYAPGSGQPVKEYLNFFHTEYGTSPAINGIVVIQTADEQKSDQKANSQPIGWDLPAFAPPPVTFGGETLRRQQAGREEVLSHSSSDSGAQRSAGDWRPDSTLHYLLPNTSTTGYLYQSFYWTGGGLYSLPETIGLEFEINLDNPSVSTPQNVRPACFDDNYKDRFWLKNYSYSWSVSDEWGTSVGALGAYADYNDLLDLCRKNSIAIGLRYPKEMQGPNIPGTGIENVLDITIIAPRGLTATSRLGGNVQAVTSSSCIIYPWMSFTDCMGVDQITAQWAGSPYGVYNRGTLDSSRTWAVAPSLCWSTWNHGGNVARNTSSCY